MQNIDMPTFANFQDAQTAAGNFFSLNFQHSGLTGHEEKKDGITEFYSKDDPGMDDTFECRIQIN